MAAPGDRGGQGCAPCGACAGPGFSSGLYCLLEGQPEIGGGSSLFAACRRSTGFDSPPPLSFAVESGPCWDVMRSFLLLAPCFLLASCAARAARPNLAPPTASTSRELLAALGTYLPPIDGGRGRIVVHEHQGEWWLAMDRYLFSVRPRRLGPDFVLPLRWPASEDADDEKLPPEVVLHPGSAEDPRWRYEAGGWTGQQFLDPVATRVVRRAASVRLQALDEKEMGAEAVLRRCVAALRSSNAEDLRWFTKDMDPSAVAALGGAERLVANQLVGLLDDLEQVTPAPEHSWLAGERALLDVVNAGHTTIWPASDDARLLAMVKQRFRSRHTLEIADGWLMRLDRRDDGGRGRCQAGWTFPDPTHNSKSGRFVATPAKPGGVSRLFFTFFLAPVSEEDASADDARADCQFRPVPGQVYQPRSGFPFYLFVDADRRIVGAQLVGYMYTELFVAPGITGDLLNAMSMIGAEEAERQAE